MPYCKYCLGFCSIWGYYFAFMSIVELIFTKNKLIILCRGGKLSPNVSMHVSQCFYTIFFDPFKSIFGLCENQCTYFYCKLAFYIGIAISFIVLMKVMQGFSYEFFNNF